MKRITIERLERADSCITKAKAELEVVEHFPCSALDLEARSHLVNAAFAVGTLLCMARQIEAEQRLSDGQARNGASGN